MLSALFSVFLVWHINLNHIKEKSCLQISVIFLDFVEFRVRSACILHYQCPMDQASCSRAIVAKHQSAIRKPLTDSLGPQFLPHPVLFNSYSLNVGKTRQPISILGRSISMICSFPLGALCY